MASPTDEVEVRSTLGSYRLLREVGRDPLGVLFLACPAGSRTFPKWAVVRRMHEGLARDAATVHAFIAATQASVRMVHRNIAATFDFGGKMALPWAAREHLYGVTVLDVIASVVGRRVRIPWALAGYIAAEAAEGVAALRSRLPDYGPPMGFISGAVAPSVFLTQSGEVKIVDGCLPLLDGLPLIDSQALPYRPREPASDTARAGRSDAFGLGVILWELCAGRRLFAGKDDQETSWLLEARHVPGLGRISTAPPLIDEIAQRAIGSLAGEEAGPPIAGPAELATELRAALRQGKRAGAEDVAQMMAEMFGPVFREQEGVVNHAWQREQALQMLDEVPRDVTSDGDLTIRLGEMAAETTTTTVAAPKRSRRDGGFDEDPTVPRPGAPARPAGPVSWRAHVAPPQPPQVSSPRIEYLTPTPTPGRGINDPTPLPGSMDMLTGSDVVAVPDAFEASAESQAFPLLPPVERPGLVPLSERRPAVRPQARPVLAQLVAPSAGELRRRTILAAGAVGFGLSCAMIVAIGVYLRFSSPPAVDAPTTFGGAASTSAASQAGSVVGAAGPSSTAVPASAPAQPSASVRRSTDPWTTVPTATPAPVPAVPADDLPVASATTPRASPATRPRHGRAPSHAAPQDTPDTPDTPPPPPPSTGKNAQLSVFCTPACDEVYDGSRALGPSPVFKVPTTAGVHHLRLRVKSVEKKVTVTVAENDLTVVREDVGP